MSRLKISEEQARRKLHYPPDRICFYSSHSAAVEDQSNMKAYVQGGDNHRDAVPETGI